MTGRWLALLAAVTSAPVAAQQAAPPQAAVGEVDPQGVQLGREIVALGYPENNRDALFGGLIDQIVAQMNQANETQLADVDADLRALVLERQGELVDEVKAIASRHIPNLMEALAHAYADRFDISELTQIRDFVATPAGQAFVQRSAELVSNPHYVAATQPYFDEITATTQRWQQDVMQELNAIADAES